MPSSTGAADGSCPAGVSARRAHSIDSARASLSTSSNDYLSPAATWLEHLNKLSVVATGWSGSTARFLHPYKGPRKKRPSFTPVYSDAMLDAALALVDREVVVVVGVVSKGSLSGRVVVDDQSSPLSSASVAVARGGRVLEESTLSSRASSARARRAFAGSGDSLCSRPSRASSARRGRRSSPVAW